MTVGSVAYAAPEQLTGAPIDGRADQYALARAAFHLLSGVPPFQNSNPAVVIGNHLTAPPPRLSETRRELAPFDPPLAVALAKEPNDRYARCLDFAQDLRRRMTEGNASDRTTAAGVTMPAAVTPPSNPTRVAQSPPAKRSRPIGIAAAIGVMVVIIGAIAFVSTRHSGTDQSRVEAQEPPQPQPRLLRHRRAGPMSTGVQTVAPTTRSAQAIPPPRSDADLGLATPMSYPACDGTGIVVLASAVTPDRYTTDVQRQLNRFPWATYLRTDHACPSLRQATSAGNPIYAVYCVAGPTQADVCAAVNAARGRRVREMARHIYRSGLRHSVLDVGGSDFLFFTDSRPVVVDVQPRHRLTGPAVPATFSWTRTVIESRGWQYQVQRG
jgi:serine/threonine protein kinase, bacterial